MKSFLQLRSADEAMAELGRTEALGDETVSSRDTLGRVLSEPVTAREDVPHFFRSNMDGFAVRASDVAGADEQASIPLRITGEVPMGEEATEALEPGAAIRVSTGAMMPPGADAVVLVEHCDEDHGHTVLVRRAVGPRQNTIAIAEDLRAGEVVLEAGHRVRGSDVGVLTGIGRAEVRVHRVPRVGVAATGDEIVEPEDDLPPGRVRNVNQYLLGSMARATGADVVDYGVVRDEDQALDRLFDHARAECDVLLLSGGSSKGRKDLVLGSLERVPGSAVHFHGVAIAPGKPTMFADAGGLPVLGVPGNPSAAAVVFTLFGSVLLRLRGGEKLGRILATRPRLRARLAEDVVSTPGREDYVRVRLGELATGADPLPPATPLRGKSVTISTIARADALLRIPRSSEGLAAGAEVEVLLFR